MDGQIHSSVVVLSISVKSACDKFVCVSTSRKQTKCLSETRILKPDILKS